MPSRVIRGEINRSRSLARVSLEADLTFRALVVAVDDYGRLEADALILKAALYPRREQVTPAAVRQWIEELAAEGCVQLYTVDGDEFLRLTGWEKHRGRTNRAKSSLYPAPPGNLPESPGTSGNLPPRVGVESRSREEEFENENESSNVTKTHRPPALGPSLAPAAALTDADRVIAGAQRRLEARRRRVAYE